MTVEAPLAILFLFHSSCFHVFGYKITKKIVNKRMITSIFCIALHVEQALSQRRKGAKRLNEDEKVVCLQPD